jgi:uncharacterized protein
MILSPLEARVLAVLVEKQRSVPDTYPLSLNALVAGCNQKTSRMPLTQASESDVALALDGLKAHSLAIESSGGRVMRYAHNTERVLSLPSQSVALLAVLILRGPQTAGELRINSERLHRFADISAVEAFLDELAQRASGALVAQLPRLPGTRETRWMQLLTGAAPDTATVPDADAPPASDHPASLAAQIAGLRDEIAALRTQIEQLKARADRIEDSRGP